MLLRGEGSVNLLKQLAETYHYEYHKNYLYINIDDYLITVRNYIDYFDPRNNGRIIYIPLNDPTQEQKEQLMVFLKANSLNLKIREYVIDDLNVLVIRLLEVYKKFKIEEFHHLINTVIKFLKDINISYEKVCRYCKGNDSDSTVIINKIKYHCHSKCREEFESKMKKCQEAFNNLPKHYGKGLLGALIGAIVASFPWIVLAIIWGYAAVFGMLICYGAYQGYKLFGGVVTRLSKYLLIIPCLLALLIAHILVVIIMLYQTDVSITLDNIMLVYSLSETRKIALQDLGIGILFVGLGYFSLLGKMKLDYLQGVYR